MKKKLYRAAIELTNGPVTSGALRRFSRSRSSRRFIPGYVRAYRINTDEISRPLSEYRSLHDFFIRELKPEARQIDSAEVVSPVDGKVEAAGDFHDGTLFQVKGFPYSLAQLLGSEEAAAKYRNGKFAVLYLSPADYHRIHSPATGRVLRQYTLGRKSYPVNAAGLAYGKAPLSGNYRMVTELEAGGHDLLLVKVGAMFVNSIELTQFSTRWEKGEEVARFSFGSTVVLFFREGSAEFLPSVVSGARVKVGQALARML